MYNTDLIFSYLDLVILVSSMKQEKDELHKNKKYAGFFNFASNEH